MPIKHIVISNNTNNINMVISRPISRSGSNYSAHLQQENDNHSNGYIETSASKLMANVTCANMFSGITSLESIDMSSFNFRNTTNMYEMFYVCRNLHTVTGIENWDVSNVSDFTRMFYGCENLSYDLSNWNVSNANTFLQTFAYSKLPSNMFEMNLRDTVLQDTFTGSIGSLNANNWNLVNCASDRLFVDISNVHISNWNIIDRGHSNFISAAESFEIEDSRLERTFFSFPNFGTPNLRYVNMTNVSFNNVILNYFCGNARNLTNVNISDSELYIRYGVSLFYNCTNLHYINMYNCVIDNCNMKYRGYSHSANFLLNCNNLYGIDLIQCNFTNFKFYSADIFYNKTYLQYVNMSGSASNSVTIAYMFNNLKNLRYVNMPNISFASDVTSIVRVFDHCTNLESVDVTNWNTQGISNFNSIFGHCESLLSLDLSGWNTRRVSNAREMFYLDECYALKKVWVPIDVVGSSDNGNNPFQSVKFQGPICDVYLEGDLSSHHFSSIGSSWNMHYNASYQDFLGA